MYVFDFFLNVHFCTFIVNELIYYGFYFLYNSTISSATRFFSRLHRKRYSMNQRDALFYGWFNYWNKTSKKSESIHILKANIYNIFIAFKLSFIKYKVPTHFQFWTVSALFHAHTKPCAMTKKKKKERMKINYHERVECISVLNARIEK